ncbi:MAG: hypothetical protein ACRCX2_09660 [Paraclostridium sp.]
MKTGKEKLYTEKDLRKAYTEGWYTRQDNSYADITESIDEFIESFNSQSKEEKEIPITYGLIKATCGWSKFAEETNRNVYVIKEFGEYEDREVFYITESQAKKLKFM